MFRLINAAFDAMVSFLTPTQYPPGTKTSRLAIFSLVLGLLSILFCVGGILSAIPGIICGHMGRAKIRQSKGAVCGARMALMGLFLSYSMFLYSAGMLTWLTVTVCKNITKLECRMQSNKVHRVQSQVSTGSWGSSTYQRVETTTSVVAATHTLTESCVSITNKVVGGACKMIVIEPVNIHWIKNDGKDDPTDLCAHSAVNFEINGVKLISSEDVIAVNAAAVFLLRTLTSDHTTNRPICEQLFPHCGHCMYDVGKEDVAITGCPVGSDFAIIHTQCVVEVSMKDGTSICVTEDEWRHAVVDFSDKVMAFYEKSKPKKPYDDTDRKGFQCMMAEWKRRRQQQNEPTGATNTSHDK